MSRRLIEEAFPLQRVSEHSRHEKSVRHGHISTLHIWPARRPLAACRAALLAALLPDPGDPDKRQKYIDRIAAVTRWGTEGSPDLRALAEEIRKAYGGRAPRVLDPFAGGGAIPFEAMRLGCEVTAVDYNPVAWFILKCALDYPSRLAGKHWPLPEFAHPRPSSGRKRGRMSGAVQQTLAPAGREGDLEAHVRAWGEWVLRRAREELGPYYPDVDGHPTVAYLWARTVPCQDPACGAEVPLLRTLWLCKKKAEGNRPGKLRALKLVPLPEEKRVEFEVYTPDSEDDLPARGTMASNGVKCPCCGAFMPLNYIQSVGQSGRMGQSLTCVVVDSEAGKQYVQASPFHNVSVTPDQLALAERWLPDGFPNEEISPVRPAQDTRGVSSLPPYGLDRWSKLFTPRQLLALATFVRLVHEAEAQMKQLGYPREWSEAVTAYLAAAVDKLADYGSMICNWHVSRELVTHTFAHFALPMCWDFCETNSLCQASGGFPGALEWIVQFVGHALRSVGNGAKVNVLCDSAEAIKSLPDKSIDVVVTDPPYYSAIPYGDLSDFFYVWLRRSVGQIFAEQFAEPLTPKARELVQHAGRLGSEQDARKFYEEGMLRSFRCAHSALTDDGLMIVVFAHKDPVAWETLASAIISAGFCVTASWPVDTEMQNKVATGARLATSVWLVCKKRPATAGPGRYAEVRRAMQERITERLRYFWDQGLSGPDFVWAAIGPALESYSRHTVVKRLDGTEYTVAEFLREVRRLVTDFALGRILHGTSTESVDEWTRYYLMHRYSFGLGPAPAGECILLAQGYGLDLAELRGPRGILTTAAKPRPSEDDNRDDDEETAPRGSSSELRLLTYDERRHPSLGEPHPHGGLPYIDSLHHLLRLWAAAKNDEAHAYVRRHGLADNGPFWAVAQAVLEMAKPKSRERSHLEALVAWGRGATVGPYQTRLPVEGEARAR